MVPAEQRKTGIMRRQLIAVLWKNLYILRWRHWIFTLTEIILPPLLFILFIYSRSKIVELRDVKIKEPAFHDPITKDGLMNMVIDGELWYTPETNFTNDIIKIVGEKVGIPETAIKHFNTTETLCKHFTQQSSEKINVITFKGNDTKKLNYEISIQEEYSRWDTDKLFGMSDTYSKWGVDKFFISLISEQEVTKPSKYKSKGFATLQTAIDMAFIQMWDNDEPPKIDFYLQQFPHPSYRENSDLSQLFIRFLPLVIVISFFFLCITVLKRVGEEKHSGAQEFLRILGVKTSVIWLGWFIHSLSANIISIILFVIFQKMTFGDIPYPIIENSDGGVLFVFLFLYCMASITFCFVIASIWNRPFIGTLIGILVWIFSYFVPLTLIKDEEKTPWVYKMMLAIFPNIALRYGYSRIAIYEIRGIGVHWNNLFDTGTDEEQDIPFGVVCLGLVADIIMFMLLTLFLENIKNGKYDKLFRFMFLKTTQLIKSTIEPSETIRESNNLINPRERFYIKWKVLNKNFKELNLEINIPENCVTVLLGPSGVGKTTIVLTLAGVIDSGTGSVKINGEDIKMCGERRVGLCPQSNLLFTYMTITENLQFFATLNGVSKTEARDYAQKWQKEIHKSDVLVKTLSREKKRKLHIAIAFAGNPEIVIIDEPISGFDTDVQHDIWNFMSQFKNSKTILVTTNSADEAKIMGVIQETSWIGIMDKGNNINRINELGIITTEFIPATRDMDLSVQNENNNENNETPTMKPDFVPMALVECIFCFIERNLSFPFRKKNNFIYTSLILKRLLFLKRKLLWYIISVFVSIAVFIFTILLVMSNVNNYNNHGVKLDLNLTMYDRSEVVYSNSNASNSFVDNMTKIYYDLVRREGGHPVKVENSLQAIIQKGTQNIIHYKKRMIIAAEFNTSINPNEVNVTAMYSADALHSLPISINLAINAFVKTKFNESFSISVANKPFKDLDLNFVPELSVISVQALWLFFIPMGMLYVMSNFIIFPNAEIQTNLIPVHIKAGVNVVVYWLINVLFDYIIICLPTLLVTYFIVYLANNQSKALGDEEFGVFSHILLRYSLICLPFIYLLGHKKSLSGGYRLLVISKMFFGSITAIIVQGMELSNDSSFINFSQFLKHLFLFINPDFALSYICLKFARKYTENFNWLYMSLEERQNVCADYSHPCCEGEITETCQIYHSYMNNEKLGIENDLWEMMFSFWLYLGALCLLYSRKLRNIRSKISRTFIRDARDQKEYLNDNFTAREQMHLNALLKGHHGRDAQEICMELLNCRGLKEYADVLISEYSDDNKRKLRSCIKKFLSEHISQSSFNIIDTDDQSQSLDVENNYSERLPQNSPR